MNREQLQDALRQLHEELDRSSAVDEDSRRLLVEIKTDIEDLLARSGDEDFESPKSIDEKLRESVIQFEGTHPALTVAINRVVDALAGMGI